MRDRSEAATLAANRSLADEIGPILLNDAPTDAVASLDDILQREILQPHRDCELNA